MQCPFCDPKKPRPNLTDLDKPVEHLIITITKEGHVHCHGPFSNGLAIKRMIDAIIDEAEKEGIQYKRSTHKTLEDIINEDTN